VNNKLRFTLFTINGSVEINSSNDFKDDRWVHIAATYDGVNAKIYENGVLTGTQSITGNIINNTNGIGFGCDYDSTSNYIMGRLQDFEVSKSLLFTSNFTVPSTIPNSNTAVLRMLFNEGTGTPIDTSTTNANVLPLLPGLDQPDWFIGKYDLIKETI
jgi:hypothetical protein